MEDDLGLGRRGIRKQGLGQRTKDARRLVRPAARLLALLFLLPLLFPGSATVQARSSALVARSSTSSVVVQEQRAEPHFPDKIDFKLKASGMEVQRAELNYRHAGGAVTAGLQPSLPVPTSTLNLSVTLDLSTHYFPPGAEIAYYWTLTGTSGEVVNTPLQTFTLVDERYKWQTLQDGGKQVSVHWHSGDAAFGKTLLDTASGALDRLQNNLHAGLTRQAHMWVYASQDELFGALAKNIPEWVAGNAFPELSLVVIAVEDGSDSAFEIKRIVPHEISHLLLYQVTRNPYSGPPRWIDEGLAVYNQEVQDPAEEDALRTAAETGRLVPLKALAGSFGADEDAAVLSYAESSSAVGFLLNDPRYGRDKFARMAAEFRKGVTYDEAFEAGFGTTVDRIDTQWRASLPYKVAAAATPVVDGPLPSPAPAPRPWYDQYAKSPYSLLGLGVAAGLVLASSLFVLVGTVRRAARRRREVRSAADYTGEAKSPYMGYPPHDGAAHHHPHGHDENEAPGKHEEGA